MVFKFLRKVLCSSSPHYITFQTFKNNNFKTGSWRCNLFAGLTTNKNEKVLENHAFHQAMENRWRSNHSYHSWKFFQTSCKGITWLNVVVAGCFSLWKEMWPDPGIHEQEKEYSSALALLSIIHSHGLTWDFRGYLSQSNRALMLKVRILPFFLPTDTCMVPSSPLSFL